MLEDDFFYRSHRLGSDSLTIGEIISSTTMTGCQEIISDPLYMGQTITFTYLLVGNYGINRGGFESLVPTLNGIVVREASAHPSNFRQQKTLHDILELHQIPGIAGVDTRSITRKIQQHGVLKAGFTDRKGDIDQLVEHLQQVELPKNEVEIVLTKTPCASAGKDLSVVFVDFDKKQNIVQGLDVRGCSVTVVPYITTAEGILVMTPDGVILSSGPGNPEVVGYAIPMIQGVLGKVPFFGICLGHQLFALSQRTGSFKMRSGHRGTNYPIKNLETGKIDITSRDRGYAVDIDSLKSISLEVTHLALSDSTVEDLKHETLLAFPIQCHPETNPGPSDSSRLFDDFVTIMTDFKEKGRHINAWT